MDQVKALYAETCDYFMIDEADEMRRRSELFFTFFTKLIDDVHKSLPSPDLKKPVKNVRKGSEHANQMAEQIRARKAVLSRRNLDSSEDLH